MVGVRVQKKKEEIEHLLDFRRRYGEWWVVAERKNDGDRVFARPPLLRLEMVMGERTDDESQGLSGA